MALRAFWHSTVDVCVCATDKQCVHFVALNQDESQSRLGFVLDVGWRIQGLANPATHHQQY